MWEVGLKMTIFCVVRGVDVMEWLVNLWLRTAAAQLVTGNRDYGDPPNN